MSVNSRIFNELREYEQQVIDGEVSPTRAFVYLKELSSAVDNSIKKINDLAIKEIIREPEKQGLITSGYVAKVLQKTTWKFDHIEDWSIAKDKLKLVEEKAKQVFLLQNQLNPNKGFDDDNVIGVVNEDSGEIMIPAIKEFSAQFIKLEKLK